MLVEAVTRTWSVTRGSGLKTCNNDPLSEVAIQNYRGCTSQKLCLICKICYTLVKVTIVTLASFDMLFFCRTLQVPCYKSYFKCPSTKEWPMVDWMGVILFSLYDNAVMTGCQTLERVQQCHMYGSKLQITVRFFVSVIPCSLPVTESSWYNYTSFAQRYFDGCLRDYVRSSLKVSSAKII